MGVVGFEVDQVRRLDMKDSTKDISVPINVAYNHHYAANLHGKGTVRGWERIPAYNASDTSRIAHHPSPKPGFREVAKVLEANKEGYPSTIQFGYSNGGEFRKTYHGLAPPYAQLIGSPQHIAMTPMQIDTWNRDEMNLTGGKFVAGPAPRNSYAPTTGAGAIYSGLLECPLTTRIKKNIAGGGSGWNDSTVAQVFGCKKPEERACAPGSAIASAQACFAARSLVSGLDDFTVTTASGSNATLPPGCSVLADAGAAAATLYWNTNEKSTACCAAGGQTHGVTAPKSNVAALGNTLDLTLDPHGNGGKNGGVAHIAIRGPATAWFGFGFDATAMDAGTYAIVVDGVTGSVTERSLGQEAPGTELAASVTVLSSSVTDGVRSVVLTRDIIGATAKHHTFDAAALSLPIISAIGASEAFAYHKAKTADTLVLWPSGGAGENAACVCSLKAAPFGQGVGTVEYLPTGEIIGFPFRCNPTESVFTNRNPTCDVRTYVGGLSACHHGWHLLDADQTVPWLDQPLEYWFKVRMYYQPFTPAARVAAPARASAAKAAVATAAKAASHIDVIDITWSIGGATGEYDVPLCAAGTPPSQCTHSVTGTVTPPFPPTDGAGAAYHFVAAHYHCHAPTCLSIEMRYGNETGPLICKETPYHGMGHDVVPQRGRDRDRFDEAGYIGQRICLWGSPPLEPPPMVSGKLLWILRFYQHSAKYDDRPQWAAIHHAADYNETLVVF